MCKSQETLHFFQNQQEKLTLLEVRFPSMQLLWYILQFDNGKEFPQI